jgi:hypothetical protein
MTDGTDRNWPGGAANEPLEISFTSLRPDRREQEINGAADKGAKGGENIDEELKRAISKFDPVQVSQTPTPLDQGGEVSLESADGEVGKAPPGELALGLVDVATEDGGGDEGDEEERELTSWGMGNDEPDQSVDLSDWADVDCTEEGVEISSLFQGITQRIGGLAKHVNAPGFKSRFDAHSKELPHQSIDSLVLISDMVNASLREASIEGESDAVAFIIYSIAKSPARSLLAHVVVNLDLEPLKAICQKLRTARVLKKEEVRTAVLYLLMQNTNFKAAESHLQKGAEVNRYDDCLNYILQEEYVRHAGVIGLFFIDEVNLMIKGNPDRFTHDLERAYTFLELSYEKSRATPEIMELIDQLKALLLEIDIHTKDERISSIRSWWVGRFAAENPKARIWVNYVVSEEALKKLKVMYARYGKGLLIGNRFIPGVRGSFMFAAGLVAIPWQQVAIWNAVSAALWNALLMLGGYVFSDNFEVLVGFFRNYTTIVFILLGLVIAWIVARMVIRRFRGKK